jgi:hypothetical protein
MNNDIYDKYLLLLKRVIIFICIIVGILCYKVLQNLIAIDFTVESPI